MLTVGRLACCLFVCLFVCLLLLLFVLVSFIVLAAVPVLIFLFLVVGSCIGADGTDGIDGIDGTGDCC